MNYAKQLRIAIETCELPHAIFMEHFKPLKQRIEDAIDGGASRIERIIGPTRVGKTMLINSLKRAFRESTDDGCRRVPLLVVPLMPSVSPLLLPSSVLTALGMPVQRCINSADMDRRMLSQLSLAGTRVLIFEEASHLVEPRARMAPRAAGDWFKMVADTGDRTVVLSGVPRLERLFQENEQLRSRASAKRLFLPYDSRIPENMVAFQTCVVTYAKLFREFGYPIELPDRALTYQCYLLSGGLIGVLSRFMQELASQIAYESPRSLTFADCQAAANGIESAGSRHFRAFESPDTVQDEVAPAALHQAFLQVMHDNDLVVPVVHSQPDGAQ